jgi:hypothetical protein
MLGTDHHDKYRVKSAATISARTNTPMRPIPTQASAPPRRFQLTDPAIRRRKRGWASLASWKGLKFYC